MATITADEMKAHIGREVVSDWVEMTREMINKFADVTGDHQFIHVDPVGAAETPFAPTTAHAFLTLSLMPLLASKADLPPSKGARMGVNYGGNKVRFVTPSAQTVV